MTRGPLGSSQRAGRADDRRADMLAALEYGVHPMVRLGSPTRDYTCACGYEAETSVGIAAHKRWCDAHPA